MKATFTLLFAFILLISCNSVKRTQKLVTRGDYDQAIELAAKKLQKDKGAKEYDEHIAILEEAYLKANEDDIRRISFLKKQINPKTAKEIYYRYLDLNGRQELIRPLLPLYSKQLGRNANFDFPNFTDEIITAKNEYVTSLYTEANSYMRRNTQKDYRSAYHVLCELDELQPNYKDVLELKEEAHFKGTDFVYVSLNNHSGQIIPYQLEQELLDFNTYGLDDLWTEYHHQRVNGITYNWGIDLNFQSIQISPELISEKRYSRNQRIKDGYDYKRDRSGNIIKDSLGNPIKIDRYKNVLAEVMVTTQQKSVFVGGTVVFRNLENRQTTDSFPLSSEFVFENIFASYRGDERALSGEDRRLLGNNYIPFPNNAQMVLDAGEDIKQHLKRILEDHNFL